MKELKDILLKKGDIVTTITEDRGEVTFVNNLFESTSLVMGKIIKIERPVKYKTIYEAPKQILDKEEKQYLENVIRPFRDRVKYIRKSNGSSSEWLKLYVKELEAVNLDDDFCLPSFKKDTMYKGMEVSKKYTLKELGLFE